MSVTSLPTTTATFSFGVGVSSAIARDGHVGMIRFSINDTISTLLSKTIGDGFKPRYAVNIPAVMRLSASGTYKYYFGRVQLNTDGSMDFHYINESNASTQITGGEGWGVYGSGAYFI